MVQTGQEMVEDSQKTYRKFQEWSKMVRKWPKMVKKSSGNVRKWSENAKRWCKMSRKLCHRPILFKMIQYGPRWSKMVHDGLKWSNMVWNSSRWSKIPKWSKMLEALEKIYLKTYGLSAEGAKAGGKKRKRSTILPISIVQSFFCVLFFSFCSILSIWPGRQVVPY